jgi:hypothetical protein
MRKSFLLLSGVGIGAGLWYALTRGSKQAGQGESQQRNSKTQGTSESAGNEAKVRRIEGASMRPAHPDENQESEPVIDNLGTNQHEAAEILKTIRDAAFDSDDEKLALALGRPVEEIEAWTSGDGTIDGDVVMKARTLADKRGVEIQ